MHKSSMDPKILIAGTGRAGTSFLMRLLTRLGYDTGFRPESDGYCKGIRAGCELFTDQLSQEWWEAAPRIIKSPYLSIHLPHVPVPIAHVICPVRDLDEVAASRKEAVLPWRVPPAEALGKLVANCTLRGIPLTLMRFPESVTDPDYCREKLAEGLPDILGHPGFDSAFASLQPEPVNV